MVYVVIVSLDAVHFFFFGETVFFDFGGEAPELEVAGDLAVFGLGAFGFLVGPALLDFLAFDGDFGFVAATGAIVLEEVVFLSPAAAIVAAADAAVVVFFDFAAAVELFFSATVFFAFGEPFLPAFVMITPPPAPLSPDVPRLVGVFLAFSDPVFLFSAVEGFATPEPADDNLNEPEAPLPFVCTSAPEATEAFRYFLMKGATFSASTL